MSVEMLIRPAEPRDVPAITRIYAHAVRYGTASFELEPPDEAEIGRAIVRLFAGGFPYLVAEIDGVMAGYAYAGPYRARPAYRFRSRIRSTSPRHAAPRHRPRAARPADH